MAEKKYIIIDIKTNLITNTVTCEETEVETLYPTSTVIENTESLILPVGALYYDGKFWYTLSDNNVPTPTQFSMVEFRTLFTEAELQKLDGFETDASITAENKTLIRTFVNTLKCMVIVDLSSNININGVTLLGEVGIVTPVRATTILSTIK